jgi:hypothetical protein
MRGTNSLISRNKAVSNSTKDIKKLLVNNDENTLDLLMKK